MAVFHTIHKLLVENSWRKSGNRVKSRFFDGFNVEIPVENVEKSKRNPHMANCTMWKKAIWNFAQSEKKAAFFFGEFQIFTDVPFPLKK